MIAAVFLFDLVWWVLALVAIRMAMGARRRVEDRDKLIFALEKRLSALEQQLQVGGAERPAEEARPASTVTAVAEPAFAESSRTVLLEIPDSPLAATPTPAMEVLPDESFEPVLVEPIPGDAVLVESAPTTALDVRETFAPPATSPLAEPRLPRIPAPAIDWENFVGVKLFSWIAGVALVFAAIFFLRYSLEHGWLSPPIRMAIGLVVGAGLLVFCEMRTARRYAVTANALDAAGIAILFATLFASHALWNLLPQLPTFVLMALVTAVAVLLSIRRDSIFISLLGLVGGFATPALLSTGQDQPIGLFGYLLMLNAGLAWVAFRKQWPLLTAVSVAFTAVYQWGWVIKFLDSSRLPLAMSIFLMFPVLHVAAVALDDRRSGGPRADPLFGRTAAISTALPVTFALYMTCVPAYGAQYLLLFGFLFLVVAGLSAVAVTRGPGLLYLFGGLSTVLAFISWFALSYTSAFWPGILAIVAAFVVLHLAVPLVARKRGSFLETLDIAVLMAPALLFVFPVLVAIEPAAAAPALPFGVLFALLAALAAAAIVHENGRGHFLSAFFALAAEAIWSAKYLTPESLLPALTMYAVFGLFYLGVPLVAGWLGRRLEPRGSGAVVLFLSLGFLLYLASGPVAASALWGMALLLAILNLGLLLEASAGTLPMLSVLGMAFSWIIIAVWWSTTLAAATLVPSLVLVAGFAIVIVGGAVWAAERATAGDESAQGAVPRLQQGLYLGLVGHLFLMFVASQPALAVPPWPLFGVLAVLDLAIGAAALYTKRGELHRGAIVASQLVLLTWAMAATTVPWPLVAMLAAGSIVAFALLSIPLARRRGADGTHFAVSAALAAFLAQAVVIVASMQSPPPAWIWIVTFNLALLATTLALAAEIPWHRLAVLAVVPTALESLVWMESNLSPDTWLEALGLVASIHALFLAYPVVLGPRAAKERDPYLAPVLASIPFFFLARRSIVVGGYGDVIGLLPVVEAACLLGVLMRLVRIERSEDRDQGRLAIVAGAALAFVTVAVPLQLDRQWITIGWALESAALAWLYQRIPHRGLLVWTAGLCIAVFVRLSLNPAVFAYHPRGALPIWNWYLYTYLVAASAMLVAARFLRSTDDRLGELLSIPDAPRVSDLMPVAAAILLFLLLNIEIADFYSTGQTLTFNFSAGLAQDLTYTLGWALFAIATLAIGIVRHSRWTRIASLALLVVTIVKAFLHDLWRLGGLYRVGSFVGLAVCLALVAVLLQRFVLGTQKEAEAT